MRCPIIGKSCLKHRGYTVEEKRGDKSTTHLVCEDCMHLDPKPDSSDEMGPCPSCGVTLDQVVGKSRLGCALCYDHFGEPLAHIIAAVQFCGEAKHTGHVPESFKRSAAASVGAVRFATELAQKIRSATKHERYEEVSRLNSTLVDVKKIISSINEKGELDPDRRAELADIVYRHMYPDSAQGLE